MKRLICAVILSVTVITLATASSLTINRCYKTLTDEIIKIEELYKNKKSTDTLLSSLKNNWEKAEPMLMFFANHDSVEEIEISLNRLINLSSTEDTGMFSAEAVRLKTLLKHLKDSESLTFESVF